MAVRRVVNILADQGVVIAERGRGTFVKPLELGTATGLTILDAGGGNGIEAIPLALQGQSMALLDCSVEMLTEARRKAVANNTSVFTCRVRCPGN